MPTLHVKDRSGREVVVDAKTGISIMENIRGLDDSVDAICGGLCSCATCHIYVADEWCNELPARGYEEERLPADSAAFDPARSRPSCQIMMSPALDGLRLDVAPPEP